MAYHLTDWGGQGAIFPFTLHLSPPPLDSHHSQSLSLIARNVFLYPHEVLRL